MSCTDRCSGKGLDRDRDLASLQIIHEFTGDVGPFGFVARAPAASFLRLDELFAIDVDDVPAAGADMVAVIDTQTIAVVVFERRQSELPTHHQHLFFPEGVHRCCAKAGRS